MDDYGRKICSFLTIGGRYELYTMYKVIGQEVSDVVQTVKK